MNARDSEMVKMAPLFAVSPKAARQGRVILYGLEPDQSRLTAKHLAIGKIENVVAAATLESLRSALNEGEVQFIVLGENTGPHISGSNLVATLMEEFPGLRVVVLACDSAMLYEAMIQGATGVVSREELEMVQFGLESGGSILSSEKIGEFIRESRSFHKLCLAIFRANLTERERLAICCRLGSRTGREAARKMGVDVSTYKSHVRLILRKLKLKNMTAVTKLYGNLFRKISGNSRS